MMIGQVGQRWWAEVVPGMQHIQDKPPGVSVRKPKLLVDICSSFNQAADCVHISKKHQGSVQAKSQSHLTAKGTSSVPVSVHLFEVWTTRLAWSCFTVTKTETTKDWIKSLRAIDSDIFLRSLSQRLCKRNHFCWRVGYVLATRHKKLREKLREVVSIAEVSYAVPTRSISPTREAMQGYADWEVGYAKCFHTNFPKKTAQFKMVAASSPCHRELNQHFLHGCHTSETAGQAKRGRIRKNLAAGFRVTIR